MRLTRRSLLGAAARLAPLGALAPRAFAAPKFQISLAQWSIHKAIHSRMLTNLDFPRVAREQFGIEGLEFVNTLWEAPTQYYIGKLKDQMRKHGSKAVLIMCDGEGAMGATERKERMAAARNHYKWVDIAADLGCHAIRTNMQPSKPPKTEAEIAEFLKYCQESYNDLCGYAAKANINVIIENHGGVSSLPDVVARLMKMVNLPNFGTLPDFGNFYEVDHYEGVRKLMPFAKGVSFKCWDFGPDGNETKLDMNRMMKIVFDAGFTGWVGIEYEGERMSEFEGIAAAKRFLMKLA